jgi:Asp-tRNA(Asn)/Glu-tRNA(Gln) amidotransferase A subunit family amidase
MKRITIDICLDSLQIFNSRQSLRIGFFTALSRFPPIGDTEEVVLEAKTTLEGNGHILLPFEALDDKHLGNWTKLLFDLRNADLGSNLCDELYAEEISPSTEGFFPIIQKPYWIRGILATLYRLLPESRQRNRRIQALRAGFDAQTSTQLWKCLAERKRLIVEMLRRMREMELDLILSPVFPFPALKVEDHPKLMCEFIFSVSVR